MIDDRLDVHLDNILKASGSALKHYSMQKTKDDMRQALRQAIAEAEKQEGQSNFCAQCEALSRELKAIKQEQGEPVGYLEIDDIESQREYPHNCRNVNLWYESGEGLVAVYTHPPQRKPLTDAQILNVARDHYNPHQRPEISFARAIEAAHGIKE